MSAVTTCAALAALIWWTIVWSICLLGWRIAKIKYGQANLADNAYAERLSGGDSKSSAISQQTTIDVPGVSILRPLRGLDVNLHEALVSSFVQRYPKDKFEIVCSVADKDDQAIEVFNRVKAQHSHIDARIIIGEEVVGVNPKINNLMCSYRSAKYDVLWILDSNVLMGPDTLGRSVSLLQSPSSSPTEKPVGLVHHVPFPIYPDVTLGSRLEQAFLSTTHAKMYIAINAPQIDSCVCGKSNMFRKSDLERATRRHQDRRRTKSSVKNAISKLNEKDRYGIAAFGEYLGEDNMIGHFLWHDGGMRHVIPADIAANAVGSMTFEDYFWRRVRWIRVRKYMVVLSTLVEPATESLLCGLLGAFACQYLLRIPPLLFVLVHMIAWYTIDVSVYQSLSKASPAQTCHDPWHDGPGHGGYGLRPAWMQAWLLRELCALPIWLFAMLGDCVSWRVDGRIYRVKTDGRVEVQTTSTGSSRLDGAARWIFELFSERIFSLEAHKVWMTNRRQD